MSVLSAVSIPFPESEPEGAKALLGQLNQRLAAGDRTGAQATLEQALRQFPGQAEFWRRHSELSLQLGHRDAALVSARRAAQLQPQSAATQAQLATALMHHHLWQEALLASEAALAINAQVPWIRRQHSEVLLRLGQNAQAVAHAQAAAALNPADVHLHAHLANVLLLGRQFEAALQAIDEALVRLPQSAEFHRRRAEILWRLERRADALGVLRQACELAPDHVPSWLRLSQWALQGNELSLAAEAAAACVARAPSQPEHQLQLSLVEARAGRVAEAMQAAQLAAGLDAQNPHPRVHLSRLLLKQDAPQLALEQVDAALALQPHNAEFQKLRDAVLAQLEAHKSRALPLPELPAASAAPRAAPLLLVPPSVASSTGVRKKGFWARLFGR